MSTCVNLNLKEFKDCCKRLNVSPTTLEPIVHEYINVGGNENSFPSDAYISERIHGREVSVLSDAQIKVWERKFSEPKTFNSNEEAVAYYNEARKYFPKESIGFKETVDSKYEVRVAKPFNSNESDSTLNTWFGNGENISSKGSEFAKQLTNPGNTVEVVYKGIRFRNAEHAYQTWKSGEFDEEAYKSTSLYPKGTKPVNKSTNYQTMVEIIIAKLQQHPELIEGINSRGGIDYLKNSTHSVKGDKYWESSGENKFIEALIDAYNIVSNTKGIYIENGRPIIMYRGYALTENREANTIDETIGHTAVDYNENLKGSIYFSSSAEEAEDYSTSRTDTSEEEFYNSKGEFVRQRNRHYTGDYGKVSSYYIKEGAVVEHYKDIKDYNKNGNNSRADVIVLDQGTMWGGTTEYIVRNPNVIVSTKSFGLTPKAKGKMTFSYGNNKRNDITSTTTFEAIQKGERTATTRYESDGHIDYWKSLKERDVIEWESKTGEKVLVRVTKPLHKLQGSGKTAEQWSQLEGWSTEYFNSKVRPRLDEAWQIEYELLETSSIVESQKTLSPEELAEREASIQDYQNTFNVSREEAEKEIDAYLNNSTAEEVSEKSKITNTHKKSLNEKHQEYLSIDKQIKNLTESGIISRSEITELAYDIVYTMSDYLTKWQDNPESILEDIEDFNPENVKKIKGLSRAELVNLVGADNILNFIKYACFGRIPENSHLSDEEQDALLDKMFLIEENFKAVMQFGISAFATVEDFSLSFSEVGYKAVNTESKDTSSNDIQSNEAQHATEENGDKQEHWQVDSKTIDNILSMSQIVKRELVRLYEIEEVIDEETGLTTYEKKKNDYGMNKRVSPRDATYSILRWTEGALTLPKMIDRLKVKADSNPWVKILLEKLTDTSGKYSDFQSQFYTTFCKHFQDYYIIKEEKAKDGRKVKKIMPVNRNPVLRQTIKDIKVLYNIQKHPLFDNKGLKKNKYELLKQAKDKLLNFSKQPYASLDKKRLATGIQYVAELLGYNTTIEEVQQMLTEEGFNQMVNNLVPIVDNLGKGLNNLAYNPFGEFKDGGIENNLRNFLKPLLEAKEDLASDSVHDSGKMYQSRIIPSWLSKTMDKFLTLEGKEYQDFLEKEYGQYEWFRDTSMPITEVSSWINPWLRQLAGMSLENRKKVFGHHVNLNYLGHNYMRNMTEPEYILSVLTAFNSGNKDVKNIQTAWYKIPMMSNKPSLEFIKFKRYSGYGYQEEIVEELLFVFAQEVKRIKTIKARGYEKGDPQYIKNFDGNRGKSFVFLDYLNDYLPGGSKANKELGKRLAAKLEDKKIESWTDKNGNTFSGDEALKEIVRQEIMDFMSQKAKSIINTYKTNGVYEVCKTIDGVGTTDTAIDEFLTEFVWNDTFASISILELTITDMAYYKDAEDVQKRLAQIHAPGLKGNIAAFDYGEYDENGKLVRAPQQVCDGNLRTIFLADFTKFKQNIIENLEIVFDRKIAQADTTAKVYWKELKKNIIEQFEKDINVADAQAYNCPTSYRKKALMFGKWSQEAEELYNKLLNGEANISDIETAFQPLKPFVYTNVTKHSDAGEMSNLKVGMQFKNSEYLLIMADALLRGEDTSKPNLLRALFDVMEDSVKKKGIDKGIDSFQFESAVKAGLQGTIDLTEFVEKGGDAKGYIESLIYDKDGNYVETRVHTFPAEDYSIQQEVPKHFMDHSQAHGSQERMIIPSDLPLTDANGNEVVFTYVSPDGKVVEKYNASTFREEYEKNLATNIEESIDNLYDELGLKFTGPDATKLRNIALSQILQKEILSSPRYGIDLYLACGVNENGEFNIPLGDPIQSKRVEQLINSIIKNRVNKQKIAGGPVVQVSNFGMSERLNIKFRDKDGNILPTFDEWSKDTKNEGKTIDDFKKELKEKQAGIAYYECYAPAYMRELFTDFMDEKGNIDIEAVEKVNPEMLEMVGYRIPSEDAYSIAPLRIKGFLPKEAGEGIVMPYEITLITGSDFDKPIVEIKPL